MSMAHAIFALIMSTLYFVLSVIDSEIAQGLTVAFVAVVLLPALPGFYDRHRHHREH